MSQSLSHPAPATRDRIDHERTPLERYEALLDELFALSARRADIEAAAERPADAEAYREVTCRIAATRERIDQLVDAFDDDQFSAAFALLPDGQLA